MDIKLIITSVDPMCTCGLEPETTIHYLLHWNLYSIQRLELLSNVCFLNPSLKNYSNRKLFNILLYGSEDINYNMNKEIVKATITYLKISERFNGPLFKKMFFLMVLTFRIYFSFFNLGICTELILSGLWLSASFVSCLVLF